MQFFARSARTRITNHKSPIINHSPITNRKSPLECHSHSEVRSHIPDARLRDIEIDDERPGAEVDAAADAAIELLIVIPRAFVPHCPGIDERLEPEAADV